MTRKQLPFLRLRDGIEREAERVKMYLPPPGRIFGQAPARDKSGGGYLAITKSRATGKAGRAAQAGKSAGNSRKGR